MNPIKYIDSIPNKLFYSKDRTCPDNCSGQGTCDATTGVCTCNAGFTGANCAGKKITSRAGYFWNFVC